MDDEMPIAQLDHDVLRLLAQQLAQQFTPVPVIYSDLRRSIHWHTGLRSEHDADAQVPTQL